ncbi:hypothetical protein ABZP36_004607 [Zizania latifolia]
MTLCNCREDVKRKAHGGIDKHDSAETIRKALHLGVNVKMITGDQLAIGKETGRRLGMGTSVHPSSAMLGQNKDASLEALPVDELIEKLMVLPEFSLVGQHEDGEKWVRTVLNPSWRGFFLDFYHMAKEWIQWCGTRQLGRPAGAVWMWRLVEATWTTGEADGGGANEEADEGGTAGRSLANKEGYLCRSCSFASPTTLFF